VKFFIYCLLIGKFGGIFSRTIAPNDGNGSDRLPQKLTQIKGTVCRLPLVAISVARRLCLNLHNGSIPTQKIIVDRKARFHYLCDY